MILVSKLDELGKAAWIAAAVFGFWVFWPVGLAVLLFLSWSGRMRQWRQARGRWKEMGRWNNMERSDMPRDTGPWGQAWGGGWARSAPTSGNRAFDEYRAETLRRLEEEQREFVEYLERLRQAKDKAEFDGFMAERRRAPIVPEPTEVR
jgi:hypothetical protein